MECKQIQDRLMTDHLDGELSVAKSEEVREHLRNCPACREISDTVRDVAVAPFKGAGELRPDPAVWQKIRERITAEPARSGGWLEKIDRVLAPILLPHPVFRVAVVTAVIFAAVVLVRWPFSYVEPAYAYVEEQMMFLGDLRSGNPDLLNGDPDDFEAELEKIAR